MITIQKITGEIIFSDKTAHEFKECVNNALKSNISFNYVDFKYKDLTGVNFKGKELKGVEFEGAILANCDFSGCTLTDVGLNKVNANNSNFQSAIMCNVNFNGSTFYNSDFRFTIIKGNDKSEFENVINTDFSNVLFRNTAIINYAFNKCIFTKIDIAYSRIKNSSFVNCDFSNSNFSNSYLYKVSFGSCKIKNAIFDRVQLHRTEMFGTDFTNTTFSHTSIPFDCDNMEIKTTKYQRQRLGRYLKKWLDRADDLTPEEHQLKAILQFYGSLDEFMKLEQKEEQTRKKHLENGIQ